jgi:hypothetical protein
MWLGAFNLALLLLFPVICSMAGVGTDHTAHPTLAPTAAMARPLGGNALCLASPFGLCLSSRQCTSCVLRWRFDEFSSCALSAVVLAWQLVSLCFDRPIGFFSLSPIRHSHCNRTGLNAPARAFFAQPVAGAQQTVVFAASSDGQPASQAGSAAGSVAGVGAAAAAPAAQQQPPQAAAAAAAAPTMIFAASSSTVDAPTKPRRTNRYAFCWRMKMLVRICSILSRLYYRCFFLTFIRAHVRRVTCFCL